MGTEGTLQGMGVEDEMKTSINNYFKKLGGEGL
jgi:hypothetical protein